MVQTGKGKSSQRENSVLLTWEMFTILKTLEHSRMEKEEDKIVSNIRKSFAYCDGTNLAP